MASESPFRDRHRVAQRFIILD
jgi:hypothetical protein